MFFAAILGGRLIAAWLGGRARAEWLAVAGIGATVLLLAIGSSTPIGPIAFALTGFALAPIFSATLIWVGSALPTSAHTNAVVIAGALLGAAVFPALIGRVIDRLGASAAPPAILAAGRLAALAAAVWLHFVRRA